MIVGVSLCQKYSLSSLDLAQSLDAFLIETSKETLELENIGKFEQMLKDNKQVNFSLSLSFFLIFSFFNLCFYLAKNSSKK